MRRSTNLVLLQLSLWSLPVGTPPEVAGSRSSREAFHDWGQDPDGRALRDSLEKERPALQRWADGRRRRSQAATHAYTACVRQPILNRIQRDSASREARGSFEQLGARALDLRSYRGGVLLGTLVPLLESSEPALEFIQFLGAGERGDVLDHLTSPDPARSPCATACSTASRLQVSSDVRNAGAAAIFTFRNDGNPRSCRAGRPHSSRLNDQHRPSNRRSSARTPCQPRAAAQPYGRCRDYWRRIAGVGAAHRATSSPAGTFNGPLVRARRP